jgi:proline iminopeptidase
VRNCVPSIEKQLDMALEGNEVCEVNTNLYPLIEPYSSGFLKVSDIHTLYWEQSGNPNGHVSDSFLIWHFDVLCY